MHYSVVFPAVWSDDKELIRHLVVWHPKHCWDDSGLLLVYWSRCNPLLLWVYPNPVLALLQVFINPKIFQSILWWLFLMVWFCTIFWWRVTALLLLVLQRDGEKNFLSRVTALRVVYRGAVDRFTRKQALYRYSLRIYARQNAFRFAMSHSFWIHSSIVVMYHHTIKAVASWVDSHFDVR